MQMLPESRFQELVGKFSTMDPIVIVGDVGIDKYTTGEVKRISPEAPVPVLAVSKEWEKLGLAANIGHNLKTLGVESTICGVVGDDVRASRMETLLEECGLNIWGLVRDIERPTTFKERITTDTQQICRIDYESQEPLNPTIEGKVIDRVGEFIGNHSAIILEDYAKGMSSEKLCQNLISLANENNKLICVDPGKSTPPKFYTGASLLKPNLKEARLMVEYLGYTYQKKNVEEMAEILSDKLNIDKIVITLGAEGMAMIDRKESNPKITVIPTAAQEVYDVSGAGDTTISLLAAGLVAGGTLAEAGWLGNCGAGVVVAKKGTATVNLQELTVYYRRLQELL